LARSEREQRQARGLNKTVRVTKVAWPVPFHGSDKEPGNNKEERQMKERKATQQRGIHDLVMRSPGMRPRPVDLDFDFEGLPMAWKEAREALERKR